MKYYCNSTLSWGEDGTGDNIQVPLPLPRVSKSWKQEVCFEIRSFKPLSLITTLLILILILILILLFRFFLNIVIT